MLPNLGRISLCRGVNATGGNLRNAKCNLQKASWGDDDVCAICQDPLSEDTGDEQNKWPSPEEGFLVKACVNGDVYHKGCLRAMLRVTPNAPCPECRYPILGEARSAVAVADATPEARRQDWHAPGSTFASGDVINSYVRWEVYTKMLQNDGYVDISQHARRAFARSMQIHSSRSIYVSEEQWYNALTVIPGETTLEIGGRGSLAPDPVVGSLKFQLRFDQLGIDVRDFLYYVNTFVSRRLWKLFFGIKNAMVTTERRASLRLLSEGTDAPALPPMTATEYDLWQRSVLVYPDWSMIGEHRLPHLVPLQEFESDGRSVLFQRISIRSLTNLR